MRLPHVLNCTFTFQNQQFGKEGKFKFTDCEFVKTNGIFKDEVTLKEGTIKFYIDNKLITFPMFGHYEYVGDIFTEIFSAYQKGDSTLYSNFNKSWQILRNTIIEELDWDIPMGEGVPDCYVV